jgi:hypothetical protein
MPNKITGPKAGGPGQLPIWTPLAARVGQFYRQIESTNDRMKKLQIRIVIFLLALTSIPDMRAMSSEEMHALLRDLSSDVGARVEAARLEIEKYSDIPQ